MSNRQEQFPGAEVSPDEEPTLQELLDAHQSRREAIETAREEIAPALEAEQTKIAEAEQRIEEITEPLTALENSQKELQRRISHTARTGLEDEPSLSVDTITAWLLVSSSETPEVARRRADKINSLNERIEAGSLPFIRMHRPEDMRYDVGLFDDPVRPFGTNFAYPNFDTFVSHKATDDSGIYEPERSWRQTFQLPELLGYKVSAEEVKATSELSRRDNTLVVGEDAMHAYFEEVVADFMQAPAESYAGNQEAAVFKLWLALKNTGVDCTDLLPEGLSLEKFNERARDRLAGYIRNWIDPYRHGQITPGLVRTIQLTGVSANEARDVFENVISTEEDDLSLSNRDKAKWRARFNVDLEYGFELAEEAE